MGRVPFLLSLGGMASGSGELDAAQLESRQAGTRASFTEGAPAGHTWGSAAPSSPSSSHQPSSPAATTGSGRKKGSFYELHNVYSAVDLHGHTAIDHNNQDWAEYSHKDCRWSLLSPHREDQKAQLCQAKCQGQYPPPSCSGTDFCWF